MIGSRDQDASKPAAAAMVIAGLPDRGYRIGLKTRADFVRAAKGRRVHRKGMSLQVFLRPDAGDTAPRFGLTVTRKVGGAVERNRIKRRFRAALLTSGLTPHDGHDYVIVARRDALTMPFAALVSDLAGALQPSRDRRTPREPRR